MRDRLSEFGDDVDVVLVTFTDAQSLRDYEQRHELGFTVARDPDRAAYRAFGLGRAPLTRVWGLATARRYAEIIRQGGWRDLRRPVDDTRQLGGDFVIDQRGMVAWAHRSTGPDDRPSIDELVDAVRHARGT